MIRLSPIFVLFSFLLAGCGSQPTSTPLEKVYGISGKSYCDELNKGFNNALQVHLTQNETQKEKLYTEALLQTLDHVYISIVQIKGNPTSLQNDYVRLKKTLTPLESGTLANFHHITDCSDLIQIGNFYVEQLNSNLIYAQPELFWSFLSHFAISLDANSRYEPPAKYVALRLSTKGPRVFFMDRKWPDKNSNVHIEGISTDTIHVTLEKFSKDSAKNLRENILEKVSELKAADQSLQAKDIKIILDLRSNMGGNLDELLMIVNFFFSEGEIGKMKSRFEELPLIINPKFDHDFSENPLIVLINNFSASASEMLSLVLQETGRAKIVGETSFGKLVGQSLIFNFENFEPEKHLGGSLAITSEFFYGPLGVSLQLLGVEPDYEIKDIKWEKFKQTSQSVDSSAILKEKDLSKFGLKTIEAGKNVKETMNQAKVSFQVEFSSDKDLQKRAEEESASTRNSDVVLSAAKILFRDSKIIRAK